MLRSVCLCVPMSRPAAADVRDSDSHLFAAVALFRPAQYSGNRQQAQGATREAMGLPWKQSNHQMTVVQCRVLRFENNLTQTFELCRGTK